MDLFLTASKDIRVNAALDVIEADLKAALTTTAQQLNDLLATKPADTRPIHSHLAEVHKAMEAIDGNHERRRRH